jgi:Uma2 family endonuclease
MSMVPNTGRASDLTAELSALSLPAVHVPARAATLSGFRDWALSAEFPARGHVAFVNNGVLVDMSPEASESHNVLKGEISRVIGNLNVELDLGRQFFDRMLLSNLTAGLSTEPDGMFVLWQTFECGKAEFRPAANRQDDFVELIGSPDWVMEIVSPSSIEKDSRLLREAYHAAGIQEYWLINALGETIDFQLLRHAPRGYERVEPRDGWHRSAVFTRAFKLDRKRHRLGLWHYTLAVR